MPGIAERRELVRGRIKEWEGQVPSMYREFLDADGSIDISLAGSHGCKCTCTKGPFTIACDGQTK